MSSFLFTAEVVRKADDRLSMTSGSPGSTDSGTSSDDAELDFDKWQVCGEFDTYRSIVCVDVNSFIISA